MSEGNQQEKRPRKSVPIPCPRCGSTEVRRSRRSSLSEYAVGALLFYPYRCRRCMHRFFSAQEKLQRFRYASCPRCGNYELDRISKHRVPVRFLKAIQPMLHRHAYRCDGCRWRFFDSRRLAPKDIVPPAPPAATPEETATHSA